jgi:hypothetical protein
MFLLKEINEQVEYLTESIDGKKTYILEGVFLQGNLKNRNGRIYPVDVLANEIGRYQENYISKNRAFGELDHPSTPSVNMTKVSHIITELKQDGDNFNGKARIMSGTPNGKIVCALMDEGCSLGVSSRGMGALKEKAGSKIVEQYFITTAADIVADPSAPAAFPTNVFENVEWIMTTEGWKKQEAAYDLVQEMKQASKADREARFFNEFKKLLNT